MSSNKRKSGPNYDVRSSKKRKGKGRQRHDGSGNGGDDSGDDTGKFTWRGQLHDFGIESRRVMLLTSAGFDGSNSVIRKSKDDDPTVRVEANRKQRLWEEEHWSIPMSRFLTSDLHTPDDEDQHWDQVRPVGIGGSSLVAIWSRNVEEGCENRVQALAVKETFPKVWNRLGGDRTPFEVIIGRRLLKLGKDNEVFVPFHSYMRYPSQRKHRIMFEALEQGNLETLIRRYNRWRRYLPEPFLWYLFHQMAKALVILQYGAMPGGTTEVVLAPGVDGSRDTPVKTSKGATTNSTSAASSNTSAGSSTNSALNDFTDTDEDEPSSTDALTKSSINPIEQDPAAAFANAAATVGRVVSANTTNQPVNTSVNNATTPALSFGMFGRKDLWAMCRSVGIAVPKKGGTNEWMKDQLTSYDDSRGPIQMPTPAAERERNDGIDTSANQRRLLRWKQTCPLPPWREIVHRDICPENILLEDPNLFAEPPNEAPWYPIVALGDFGHAFETYDGDPDNPRKYHEDIRVIYDAPEQHEATTYQDMGLAPPSDAPDEDDFTDHSEARPYPLGSWTNVYQLGAVMYRALTLENFTALRDDGMLDIPADRYPPYTATLVELLCKCLAQDPRDRPTTIVLYNVTFHGWYSCRKRVRRNPDRFRVWYINNEINDMPTGFYQPPDGPVPLIDMQFPCENQIVTPPTIDQFYPYTARNEEFFPGGDPDFRQHRRNTNRETSPVGEKLSLSDRDPHEYNHLVDEYFDPEAWREDFPDEE